MDKFLSQPVKPVCSGPWSHLAGKWQLGSPLRVVANATCCRNRLSFGVAGESGVNSRYAKSPSSPRRGGRTYAGSQGSININFRLTMTAN